MDATKKQEIIEAINVLWIGGGIVSRTILRTGVNVALVTDNRLSICRGFVNHEPLTANGATIA
nr:hypothetical protein [Nitrosomonas sp.]